jgi:hypothetical protein
MNNFKNFYEKMKSESEFTLFNDEYWMWYIYKTAFDLSKSLTTKLMAQVSNFDTTTNKAEFFCNGTVCTLMYNN